jgi:hypothetical protein
MMISRSARRSSSYTPRIPDTRRFLMQITIKLQS